MDKTKRIRLAWWRNSNDKNGANVKNVYYGREPRYPEAIPADQEAQEILNELTSQAKLMNSRYPGECSLTDEDIQVGDEIYYLHNYNGFKIVLKSSEVN